MVEGNKERFTAENAEVAKEIKTKM